MEIEAHREQIIAGIESKRPWIVSNFLDCIYSDPFWSARFGPQGRERVEEDVNNHLDNLMIAIRFDLHESTMHYYHHLQNMLIYRGICTRYLRETLDILHQSIAGAIPDHWEEVQPSLSAGYDGLAYCNPASRMLMEKEDHIAEAVLKRSAGAFDNEIVDHNWRVSRRREILILVSYLADAQEKSSRGILSSHVHWLSEFYSSQGLPPEVVFDTLSLFSKEITRQLPAGHARRLRGIIHYVKMGA